MAAAKGMLPLAPEEMLEVLIALATDASEQVRTAAAATMGSLDPASFLGLVSDPDALPDLLAFLCGWPRMPRDAVESLVFNRSTPDPALVLLASTSTEPSIIEAISMKQQTLIRNPEIIDAILSNPARSPEAERRALEVRREFFEKQFGAKMVAEEQRLREEADAARLAALEAAKDTVSIGGIEDLVRLGLIEEGVDDSLISEYESMFGPLEVAPPTPEQQIDLNEILSAAGEPEQEISEDRKPVFQQIAIMSVKERVMLAIKGTREARMILVRDPNRIVAGAVLRNPRLTDAEVESISAIKTVPEDVLRQIGQDRAWTRSYSVIHNLVRNPRTPISISLGFLNRILTRDLRVLSLNKNIPDVIRTTASRLYLKRGGA